MITTTLLTITPMEITYISVALALIAIAFIIIVSMINTNNDNPTYVEGEHLLSDEEYDQLMDSRTKVKNTPRIHSTAYPDGDVVDYKTGKLIKY